MAPLKIVYIEVYNYCCGVIVPVYYQRRTFFSSHTLNPHEIKIIATRYQVRFSVQLFLSAVWSDHAYWRVNIG